jgi:uncharacterized protein (DUF983 family)
MAHLAHITPDDLEALFAVTMVGFLLTVMFVVTWWIKNRSR